MASAAAARINLTDATLKPFQDNPSTLEVMTATDDAGVIQFLPNTILQADGFRPSDVPMDRLLSLLLEVCQSAVPGEGTNEELGLVAVLLAANEGGGDATTETPYDRRPGLGVPGG